MKVAAVIAFYAAVFFWGWRQLRGKGSGLNRLLLGGLLGWAAYINLAGIAMVPHLSISSVYIVFFQPVGRAIIGWLGG
ncbi:hypothetical protein [Paenibacillus rhizophilus]|uniref:Uncharacterized protein n=1 Tax=Paenibacillus rhizophilus TaxID=1850366 RepID=A0A3N9P8D5_9BACL|nr:hypothetical protein [Paenibacillus rhizophilus]RQW11905.1 hypothetical protein EH198_09540 [Paenibacillus rhizophilus]